MLQFIIGSRQALHVQQRKRPRKKPPRRDCSPAAILGWTRYSGGGRESSNACSQFLSFQPTRSISGVICSGGIKCLFAISLFPTPDLAMLHDASLDTLHRERSPLQTVYFLPQETSSITKALDKPLASRERFSEKQKQHRLSRRRTPDTLADV